MVQPILDNHCIRCHDANHEKGLDLQAWPKLDNSGKKIFNSSYLKLTETSGKNAWKYTDWITQESKAAPIAKFPAPGSGTSPLADTLLKNHNTVNLTPEELETIFCWMDMMVPHNGSYFEGMLADDSAKYVNYFHNNRYKHIEWEKTNIQAFVTAGQWENAIYSGGSTVSTRCSNARVSDAGELKVTSLAGRLAVRCPGTGMISVLDMKGRVLKNLKVNDMVNNGKQQVVLPWTMPSGIYVVKFKGKDVVRQRVVAHLITR